LKSLIDSKPTKLASWVLIFDKTSDSRRYNTHRSIQPSCSIVRFLSRCSVSSTGESDSVYDPIMRWCVVLASLLILTNHRANADEAVVIGVVDSPPKPSGITVLKSPTIARVIALHDIPQSKDLWKPTQSLTDFESIVDTHERATGIAFAIDSAGNLATAAHVVQDSRCIWIVREDGIVLPAIVVGIDRRSDLAVIRTIDSTIPFELGAEASTNLTLRTGANRLVHSIDASLIGQNRSLPTLSRTSGRNYSNLIEFAGDARAGDSGSPLVDASGRVVGMLCAVIERTDSPTSGFAIPFDSRRVERLHSLARGEQIVHGYAGVELTNVSEPDASVRIEAIAYESPAEEVFRAGDQIKSINNEPVTSAHQVSEFIDASPDKTLTIEIVRADQPMKIDLNVRTRLIETDSVSLGEFVWMNAMLPSSCFDEIVTSNSIEQFAETIDDSMQLARQACELKPIEVWRAGERAE